MVAVLSSFSALPRSRYFIPRVFTETAGTAGVCHKCPRCSCSAARAHSAQLRGAPGRSCWLTGPRAPPVSRGAPGAVEQQLGLVWSGCAPEREHRSLSVCRLVRVSISARPGRSICLWLGLGVGKWENCLVFQTLLLSALCFELRGASEGSVCLVSLFLFAGKEGVIAQDYPGLSRRHWKGSPLHPCSNLSTPAVP